MEFFKKLLMSGEEGLFLQTKGITKLAIKSNTELASIINGKMDLEDFKKIQKNASNEYMKLSHLITSGAIAPNLIDDMLQILDKEENILDSIFKLSRQFLRYKVKDKKVSSYLNTTLLSFNGYADTAITLLSQMHSTESINKMRAFRSSIKLIEKEGDMLRDNMLDFAYTVETDFKLFYHLTDLAYLCDDILDSCEDSSDIFLSIMLSITT